MRSPDPSTTDPSHEPSSTEALERLGAIAADLGAEATAEEARELVARVAEGRFYVACVGQFKRGKSTLLDAFLGERILPTGVLPVTTIPTIVRHGARRRARVRAHRGGWRDVDPATLGEFVSDEHNPENVLGIDAVELFLPHALLAGGMCLVDTPGIGSVFAGNTAATRDFVPHIDAALVVIGADPPLSGDELVLVEEVARRVPDLIFVLNKADRATEGERAQAVTFARRVVERRLGRAIGPIFQVSATERLEGPGPRRDWPALVAALTTLAGSGPAHIAQQAGRRGVRRIGNQLLAVLDAERNALLRPIADSESRLKILGRTVTDADDSLADLSDRLVRDQRRQSQMLAAQADAFVQSTLPTASQELVVALRATHSRWGPARRSEMMDAAQATAKCHVLPWLAHEETQADDAYRRTTARFVETANDFLRRFATAEPEIGMLPEMLDTESGFRVRSEFCFSELMRIAHPASPLRYALDGVLGALGAYGPLCRDADRFLARIISVNASRIHNDLDQRLSESRRRLEADIRRALIGVRTVAERALERARKAHAAGEVQVREAIERLGECRSEIELLVRACATDSV